MENYGAPPPPELTSNDVVPLPPLGSPGYPYLSKTDGSWICRYCCSNHSNPSSVWKVEDGSPPTASFVAWHMSACRGGEPPDFLPHEATGIPTGRVTIAGIPKEVVAESQADSALSFLVNGLPPINNFPNAKKISGYLCLSCGSHFKRWKTCRKHMRCCYPPLISDGTINDDMLMSKCKLFNEA